jgi:hypothetical protein
MLSTEVNKTLRPINLDDVANYIFSSNNTSELERINPYCFSLSDSIYQTPPILRLKIDSGCSRSVSGIPGRLSNDHPITYDPPISITGFNNSTSSVTAQGINSDSKIEYYVKSMPSNLALLCAADYAQDGAIILLKDKGYILDLSDLDLNNLIKYILNFKISKNLIVRGNTYEVDFSNDYVNLPSVAYSSTANKYFNSKINVSSNDERILAMLLCGLPYKTLEFAVKNGSITSLPRDITRDSLLSFSRKYGNNPEILQLSLPDLAGNVKGYMKPADPIIKVGQLVEGDYVHSEINEDFNTSNVTHPPPSSTNPNMLLKKKSSLYRKKLLTHGQASAMYVYKDIFSGYVNGHLVKNLSNSLDNVKIMNNYFKLHHHSIHTFAADIGVISASHFQVMIPVVTKYLISETITPITAEAYNHNNGTPHLDADIKQIHQLIRFAFLYILRNPNMKHLKFTRTQILKLWGELFYWALTVINLKESPNNPGITRYEAFHHVVPDLRKIRLLPIFAILYVLRHKNNEDLNSAVYYWEQALYVGPSLSVPGCIRAAVVANNNTVQIIITSQMKCISDGGDLPIHQFATDPLADYHDEEIDYESKIEPTLPISVQKPDIVNANSDKSILLSSTYLAPSHVGSDADPDDQSLPVTNADDSDPTLINQCTNPTNVISNPNDYLHSSRPAIWPIDQETLPSSNDLELRGVNTVPIIDNVAHINTNTLSKTHIPFDKVRGDEDTHNYSKPTISNERKVKFNSGSNNTNNQVLSNQLKRALYRGEKYAQSIQNQAEQSNNEKVAIADPLPIRIMEKLQNPNSNFKSKNNPEKKKKTYSDVVQNLLENNKQVSRTDRLRLRSEQKNKILTSNLSDVVNFTDIEGLEQCFNIDWQECSSDKYYYAFGFNCYIQIEDKDIQSQDRNGIYDVFNRDEDESIVCYKAVVKNVPKSYTLALQDPKWGDPARVEIKTLTEETGCIIEISKELAKQHIENGAEVLRLIPVYEEKIKEGKTVYKVRLVADGSRHNKHTSTYSPTPSREELFILLHIFATLNIDFYHVDEKRAFLNAKKQDERPRLAKIPSIDQYYDIQGALYGTRDAPRDYNDHSASILINEMLCKRLHFCSCIYVKQDTITENDTEKKVFIFVFQHADDYAIGGNNNDKTISFIEKYTTIVPTTPPIKNPKNLLGLELSRDHVRRIIKITIADKITEVYNNFVKGTIHEKERNIPLPKDQYIIKDSDFELLSDTQSRYLDKEEQHLYLTLVGNLIWIQGLRLDVIFAVLYLSWNTKKPRFHHLRMAYYCVGYLYKTRHIPLVLGGPVDFQQTVYSDASLGTGPKGRSPIAVVNKLNSLSGAISASVTAGQSPYLSSFECELDGITRNFKSQSRLSNILNEFDIAEIYKSMDLSDKYNPKGQSYSDNEAMINFIKGDSITKGIRHMELRLWYTRDEYKKGKFYLDHMSGETIPADPCTKPTSITAHREHTKDIMGLRLTGEDYYA